MPEKDAGAFGNRPTEKRPSFLGAFFGALWSETRMLLSLADDRAAYIRAQDATIDCLTSALAAAQRRIAELEQPKPPEGVVRILLGEHGEPRRCLAVPAGSMVAVDLAAEEVVHAAGVRVPEEGRALHHDSTITTPSDLRDWNALRGFQPKITVEVGDTIFVDGVERKVTSVQREAGGALLVHWCNGWFRIYP